MKILTIIFWAVAALALIGLVIWFLTGTVFGIGQKGWSLGDRWQTISGPFETAGTYNVAADDMNSIYVNWVAGEISVIPYDGSEIQFTEYARRELQDDEKLHYSSSGGTLTIRFTARDFTLLNLPEKKLEILIPYTLSTNFDQFTVDTTSGGVSVENINAGTFKVDTVSGNVNLKNINSQTFEVDTTSGSITISSANTDNIDINSTSGAILLSDVSAKKLKGDTTSGSCDLSGSFDNVDIDSVSGRISITSTIVPQSLRVDTTSGNITVTVPGNSTISVSHSSVSGKLSSDIPIITQGQSPQFRFSTVSGGVKIEALD